MSKSIGIGDIVKFHVSNSGFTMEVEGRVIEGPKEHGSKIYWIVETSKPKVKTRSLFESDIIEITKSKKGSFGEFLDIAIKERKRDIIFIELYSTFEIENKNTGERKKYTLTPPNLSSPQAGLIGINTPLGQLVLNNYVGHRFNLPSGEHEIIEIEPPPNKPPKIADVLENKIKNVGDIDFGEKNIIIKSDVEARQIIEAGPGTGKSFCLAYKCAFLIENKKVSPSEILVLSFSREAVAEVKKRLGVFSDSRIQMINPLTIDSFASWILIKNNDDGSEWMNRSYDSNIEEATKNLDKFDLKRFKHIFIDEIQDIVGVRSLFILSLLNQIDKLCGFSIFGDFNQSIYDWATSSQNSKMDSFEFKKTITNTLKNTARVSLNNQHRISGNKELALELEQIILDIENGSLPEHVALQNFIHLLDKISIINENGKSKYSSIGFLAPEPHLKKAFLTRTNGQIIGELVDNINPSGIQPRLLGKYSKGLLPAWVSKFLYDIRSDGNIIDKDQTFRTHFNAFNNKEGWEFDEAYSLLKSIERGNSPDYIHLAKMKKNLKSIKEIPLSTKEQAQISTVGLTLSTIHCSKGLEFDDVALVEPSFDKIKTKKDLIDELKIFYVGITRAKRSIKRIPSSSLSKFYALSEDDHNPTNRWYRKTSKSLIFNVDLAEDIDGSSFITHYGFNSADVVQDYIHLAVNVGDEVLVVRQSSPTEDFRYFIYHQGTVIGTMSLSFYRSMLLLEQKYGIKISRFNAKVGKLYSEYRFDPYTPNISSEYSVQAEVWLAIKLQGLVIL